MPSVYIIFTHDMLKEGLASLSITAETVCWGKPKHRSFKILLYVFILSIILFFVKTWL